MPLPDYKPERTFAEHVDSMHKAGWTERIETDWIIFDSRRKEYQKMHLIFDRGRYACQNTRECMGSDLVFLQLRPTGVYVACAVCRVVYGPVSNDSALYKETPIVITRSEARKILAQTGQMEPPSGRSGSDVSRVIR